MNESIISGEVFENNDLLVNKANFVDRIKSMVIDSFVIVVLLYLTSLVFGFVGLESTNIKMAAFVLIFLYEPIMTSIGQTMGQRIVNIRVVTQSSLENKDSAPRNLNIMKSILRYVFKLALGIISLLTIHSDKYGRALHDQAANSVMINQ